MAKAKDETRKRQVVTTVEETVTVLELSKEEVELLIALTGSCANAYSESPYAKALAGIYSALGATKHGHKGLFFSETVLAETAKLRSN